MHARNHVTPTITGLITNSSDSYVPPDGEDKNIFRKYLQKIALTGGVSTDCCLFTYLHAGV